MAHTTSMYCIVFVNWIFKKCFGIAPCGQMWDIAGYFNLANGFVLFFNFMLHSLSFQKTYVL